MSENGCFPIELDTQVQAIVFLEEHYPADQKWVNLEVIHSLRDYNGQNSTDLIQGLVRSAHNIAINQGESLAKEAPVWPLFHLPSFLTSILEVESRLGIADKQFGGADQLDVLIEAENSIAKRNQKPLEAKRIRLGALAKDVREKVEMKLLEAELEEDKRKVRIEEMTGMVVALRTGTQYIALADRPRDPENSLQ